MVYIKRENMTFYNIYCVFLVKMNGNVPTNCTKKFSKYYSQNTKYIV